MRVLLIGHYGVGHLSDDLMCYAIVKTLKNLREDVEVEVRPLIRPLVSVLKTPLPHNIKFLYRTFKPLTNYDLIILGGGTILGQPLNGMTSLLKSKIPFSIFGAGYREELKNIRERKERIKLLVEKADYLVLRGMYSASKVEEIVGSAREKLLALGDPLFLLKPPIARRKDWIGINLRRIPPREVSDFPSHYYENLLKEAVKEISTNEGLPLFSLSFSREDFLLGPNFKQLKTPEEAIKAMDFKFWIGQRLHSSGLALLKGIPALFFNYQFNKAMDFLSVLKYPHVVLFCGNYSKDLERILLSFEKLKKEWNGSVIEKIKKTNKRLFGALRIILEEIK